MLVIDDIGAEHGSEYGTQKLLELLDRRAGKWTFITSNLTMERFAELDNRIASRLIRGHNRVLQIVTQDYALRNN
jgi:DNA replication protein DnaC